MVHYFGSHINIFNMDKFVDGAKEIKKHDGNFLQIFLTTPGRSKISDNFKKQLIELKKYLDKNSMKIVVHSSYLHNLARNWDKYSWWIKNIELEIQYAHLIGAIGLVIHFGKYMELSINEAYNNMYTSLLHLHTITQKYSDIKIFLETSTGQGTEMCYQIEDLAHFYKKISKSVNKSFKKRVKLCIDTCHIFSAGYNIQNKQQILNYLETFEELIGLRYVKLIHLNDSRVDIGAQVDRHAEIGKGFIGFNGLKHFFNYFKKLNVPIILETPNAGYQNEIKRLLNL